MTNPFIRPRTRRVSLYGAVLAGTQVRFTVRPPSGRGYSRVIPTAWFESWTMPWWSASCSGMGSRVSGCLSTGTLETGEYVGLVWYTPAPGGIGRTQWSWAGISSPSMTTLRRSPGGLERAHLSDLSLTASAGGAAIPDPTGMVGGRTVHQSWRRSWSTFPMSTARSANWTFWRDSCGVREKLDPSGGVWGVETIYFCPIFEGWKTTATVLATMRRLTHAGDEAPVPPPGGGGPPPGDALCWTGVQPTGWYQPLFQRGTALVPQRCPVRPSPWRAPRLSPLVSFHPLGPTGTTPGGDLPSRRSMRARAPISTISSGENSIVKAGCGRGGRLAVGRGGRAARLLCPRPSTPPPARPRRTRVVIGEVWEDGSNKIAYGERQAQAYSGDTATD